MQFWKRLHLMVLALLVGLPPLLAEKQYWVCDGTFFFIPQDRWYYVVTFVSLDPDLERRARPWELPRERLPRNARELVQVLTNSIVWSGPDQRRRPDQFRDMQLRCEKLGRADALSAHQERSKSYRDQYESQGYGHWLTGNWHIRKRNWEGLGKGVVSRSDR